MNKENITKMAMSFIAGATLILTSVVITQSGAKEMEEIQEREEREFQNLMRPHEAESIMSIIDTEGFDAAFRHYSNYRDINDPYFHHLRANYVDAARELLDYLHIAKQKNDF
jgi:hypothetical protein